LHFNNFCNIDAVTSFGQLLSYTEVLVKNLVAVNLQ